MTIDEAIKSERIKAEYLKEQINSPEPCIKASKCLEMAEEHEQYIEWLEELKFLRTTKETMYREIYGKGRHDVIDKINNLKECYVDACNMCTKTECAVCAISNFIDDLEELKENKE